MLRLKTSSTYLIIILSLLATSCLNYTQITTIKTDNSGEMFIHYWIHYQSQNDSIAYKKQKLFNKDSIKIDFKCRTNKINNVEVYNDISDSTIHGKINFTFSEFDSLNFVKAFKNMKFSISEGKGKTKVFTQSIPTFITGLNPNDSQIQYIYYLPGKIVSHNASSLTSNKLIWNLTSKNLESLKELRAVYIPFRLKETPHAIYYLTFIIILIVLYYLLRKKNK